MSGELITNAIHASPDLVDCPYGLPTVQMWLCTDHERVLIQVWDANDQLPVQRVPDPESEHGRGLAIVDAVSESYGAIPPEWNNGKIVWARCDVPGADGPEWFSQPG